MIPSPWGGNAKVLGQSARHRAVRAYAEVPDDSHVARNLLERGPCGRVTVRNAVPLVHEFMQFGS